MSDLPSSDQLNELLRYDSETGRLYWLPRDRRHFNWIGSWKTWNTKYANKEALYALDSSGYRYGCINYKYLRAHRVIWVMSHGYWPDQVDHINGIRTDNRLENLRDVDSQGNNHNTGLSNRNTSGVIGVDWKKSESKWRARIFADGEEIRLGLYVDFGDAVKARLDAEQRFGFHENHGKIAA